MSELVEPVARAIAAHKRRLPTDHPEIDRVWSSYCGQVRAALSVLEPRIEQLERELGWQDIATAPKDGRGILVVDVNAPAPEAGCAWYLFGKWSAVDPDGEAVFEPELYHAMVWKTPTHWRPLPPAPTGERE